MEVIKLYAIKKGSVYYWNNKRQFTDHPNEMKLFFSKSQARKDLYFITQNYTLDKHCVVVPIDIVVHEPKFALVSQISGNYFIEFDENKKMIFGDKTQAKEFPTYKTAYRYNYHFCGKRCKVIEL